MLSLYLKFSKFPSLLSFAMKEVFDEIAESWYRVRHYPRFRQELEEIARRWRGGKLLNIGCAHGPDFLPFRYGFELLGLDFSKEMIKLAQKYADKFGFEANLVVGDACFLPYRKNSFDWAISIAAYHNIVGREVRQKAFNELKAALKPGGEAFVTVWNRWQPRFWFRGREVRIPWRLKDKTVYRYYYLFSYRELMELATKTGFEILKISPEKSYHGLLKIFSQNICLLVRNPPSSQR